ncbi:MAG: hypothetical protein HYT31_03140 [Parcubacteria group bacterium]|nr:hypothetical protein [Parcubacteria group bacterium]
MDNQNEQDQPVTQREFKKDISDVKESIDFIIQNAATKEDLTQFKSDILTGVDKVFKEVKTMREEQTMKVARDDRQDDEIIGIKRRVTRVETHVGLEPLAG